MVNQTEVGVSATAHDDGDWVRAAPKVLLHDHLDGGVRPATIVELADDIGYDGLPTTDPAALADYLQRGADRNDLALYLEMFTHTVAVMRSPQALQRVVREAIEDYRNDGIVYAEVRFAPSLLAHKGFGLDDVLAVALETIASETTRAEAPAITVGLIVDAMRTEPHATTIVDAAIRHRDAGAVGFDIAGPEHGFPAIDHVAAFERCRELDFPYTIHAGEGDGVESIRQAVELCGAHRLGHGVRIMEDRHGERWGPLASHILDERIVLEVCPTSNIHTGIAPSIQAHPVEHLRQSGFAVTINTDNRTMSRVNLCDEWQKCVETFGWDRAVMAELTRTALDAAFASDTTKQRIDAEQLTPFFGDAG